MRHVTLYRDRRHEWRWRVVASNGRILADSGEGYRRIGSCLRIVRSLFPGLRVDRPTPAERVCR